MLGRPCASLLRGRAVGGILPLPRALPAAPTPLLLTLPRRHLAAAGRVVVGGAGGGTADAEASGGRRRRAPPKAVLEMTESAAQRISHLLRQRQSKAQQQEEDAAIAVRIGVKSRGCNGLSYTMDYATSKAKLEEEVERDGARVFVESKALMHVIGTTMDYVEDDLTAEFVFHNPNAEASCGCGESFTVGTGSA